MNVVAISRLVRVLLAALGATASGLAALPQVVGAQLPTNQRLYDTVTTMPELRASRVAAACPLHNERRTQHCDCTPLH